MSAPAFQEGYKPASLFPNPTPQMPASHEQISREMHILAAVHKLPAENARHFDLLSQSLTYENHLYERGVFPCRDNIQTIKQLSVEIADLALRDNAPVALTHRAFLLTNSAIECDEEAIRANGGYRRADYATDLGTYVVTRNLQKADALYALEEYLDREPLPQEIRHCWAMVGLSAWTGYLWCLLEGERTGMTSDMEAQCFIYASTFLKLALDLYLVE